MSIQKLELQGATLSGHVIIQVHSELSSFIHLSFIHSWCDFMIVLHWLNGDSKRLDVFVGTRVEEVHKFIDVDC